VGKKAEEKQQQTLQKMSKVKQREIEEYIKIN
jgi:hypothetical protein